MVKVTELVKIDITPDRPMYIAGHAMRKGMHKGIHDPIEVTFLGLEVDDEKFLLMEGDVSNWDKEFVREVKYALANRIGLKYDNIILSVGHSHSAPLLSTRDASMPHDQAWREEVTSRTISTSIEVMTKCQFKEVSKVVWTTGESYGFYGNRNSKDKYGDQNIYVIEFKDPCDKTISALVNMSCHSTVLSPEDYDLSGDLLAAVRRKLIPVLGLEPLICNGCAGDMSNRLYRQNNDYNELMRVSQGIADDVSKFTNTYEINLSSPKTRAFNFVVDYDPDVKKLEERLKKAEADLGVATEYDARKWLISEINGFKRKIKEGHVHLELETTVIRMGDLEVVVMPTELVAALGKQIKKSSQAKACFVWGYANGACGYVVEASEFNGGHDGISTQLPKGKAEEYVALCIQNLFDNE